MLNCRPAPAPTPTQNASDENENNETPFLRQGAPGQTLAAAPLRRRPDPQIADRFLQPEENLRKPPERPLSHRGDRFAGAAPSRRGGPNPRPPHAGAQAPSAHAKNHWRPF